MGTEIKTVKRRKSGAGMLFLGIFLGFILSIGSLVGLGFLAYNKMNVNFLNKTFKTDINLGSDELNNKTIKQFVSSATNMISNIDSYSLNDLKNDFGVSISDEVMGIDITELKAVPIGEIPDELQKKFNKISADELEGVMDLNNMSNILNKCNAYYYNSTTGKLYNEQSYVSSVAFDYTIESGKVVVRDQQYEIKDGKVEIELRYLPLTTAINDFTKNMGDQITLGELETDYGVKLPEYFNGVDRKVTINQLSDEIDNLQLANFLGYSYDNTTGKYYNDLDKDGVLDSGEELTGIMNALADTTISGVSEKIDSLKLSDLFTDEELNKGALSLIDKDTNVNNIDSALETAFETVTFEKLITAELVDKPAKYDEIKDKYLIGSNTKIKDLTLTELVSAFANNIPTSDTPAG